VVSASMMGSVSSTENDSPCRLRLCALSTPMADLLMRRRPWIDVTTPLRRYSRPTRGMIASATVSWSLQPCRWWSVSRPIRILSGAGIGPRCPRLSPETSYPLGVAPDRASGPLTACSVDDGEGVAGEREAVGRHGCRGIRRRRTELEQQLAGHRQHARLAGEVHRDR